MHHRKHGFTDVFDPDGGAGRPYGGPPERVLELPNIARPVVLKHKIFCGRRNCFMFEAGFVFAFKIDLVQQAIDEKTDIADALKQFKNDEGNFVREGFFETILANLNLPSDAEYKERLKHLESGIHMVTKEKRQVSYLFQQVDQFLEQYLQTKEQVNEQLKTQYEPQLKEKERLLAQQMGAQITLTPESDPEFMNLLAKNYARLDEQYNQALGQVKEELKRVASFKK